MEPEVAHVEPQPPGQVLARERERQGLSRQEVAARIHMSPWQVEALEAGDYARLPRGTFLRGFVRNYAKALGLAPDALLPLLAGAGPAGAPGIVVPSQNIRFDPMGDRLANPYVKAFALAAAALLLGFAAMYWWIFIRPTPPAAKKDVVASVPVEPAPRQLATAPVAPAEAPPPREAPMVEESKPEDPVPAPAAEARSAAKAAPATKAAPVEAPAKVAKAPPAPRPEPAPAPARAEPTRPEMTPVSAAVAKPGEGRIHLRFKGESWVEVRDAAGRLIYSRLHAPDTVADVAGKPPLAVVVGNAPLVEMTYNDRAFNLEPHTRVAVARFTLN